MQSAHSGWLFLLSCRLWAPLTRDLIFVMIGLL